MSSTSNSQSQAPQSVTTPANSNSGNNAQPTLAQLWSGLGGEEGTDRALNTFGHNGHSSQSNISNGHNNSNSNNSNNSNAPSNNYVNFNQFILQHNLLNTGSGGGGGGSGNIASPLTPAALISPRDPYNSATVTNNVNSSDVADNFFNFIMPALHKTNGMALENYANQHQQQDINYFNPNSNLFPYNNLNGSTMAYANGDLAEHNYNTFATTSQENYNNYYDNLYTPFGQDNSCLNGGSGFTSYFANPFATGFDFSASNLQANAPEFVPRFGSLSLDEDKMTSDNKFTSNTAKEATMTVVANTNVSNNGLPQYTYDTFELNAQLEQQQQQKQKQQQQASAQETETPNSTQNQNTKILPGLARVNENGNTSNNAGTTSSSSSSSPSTTAAHRAVGGATSKAASNAAADGVAAAPTYFHHNSRSDHHSEPKSKYYFATNATSNRGAERERERDNRRFHNGRRAAAAFDFQAAEESRDERRGADRSERLERATERSERDRNERERGERLDRGGGYGHRNSRDRDYHQRYENHRSNKRRDDWNRNRDRINGFRDTFAADGGGVGVGASAGGGKESPLPSPEKKPSPKKVYPENEKLSQREKLIRDIETRRLECLVCVEPIKGHHSVWSCLNCYHILHLQCIIKWASSSKSDDGWRCPACQNVVKEVPRDYYCFCGKLKNPPYNRQDVAHSCGEVCGRVEGCPHACTLLCHPGPCPPCQANVRRECGCGKTTKTMQCFLKEEIECDATCGKLLNCEVHTCSVKCHSGKCGLCAEKVEQTCHCTKQERQVACTRDSHDKRTYSCGKLCGKDLACGNHKCKDCCHAGECRPCKQSPEAVTSCPCGKMPVLPAQRTSCLDPIPVCEGACGKTLRCGKAAHPHHCTSKCHLGNCPPCNKQTAIKCRCGHMDQMIKCRQLSTRADDARCKKRCVKKRSCGKHKCNQECCIDIDHICPLPCNYTLSCGKHKCDQPCHRGNCPSCYRSSFEELYCECGAEVIYPPVPCGTKRPLCKKPCSRSHPCEHPPQHNCHAAPSCPPCMMFTTKWCFGQHEQRKTIPCSQESFSCGLACQKPLPCGRHKCIKTCHEGVCQVAGEVCKQSCTAVRATCGHKCMAPCHEGACPETPCKEMVEVQCECGNRKQMRACHDLAREYSRITTAQLASSMAEMQRGNYMELSEILAPVKMNKTNKTLDCNDECHLLERNRRLAIGLQIRNPDLPQKLLTKYSDSIRNFAKRDPALVKSIHDALTNLVKLAKESKQKSRSHSFPTMNREKRQLVHEMCEMFGVESVAYDAEPNRNVVATAYRDRSWLPAASILEVLQRESGQRRVPVPSNNAWGTKR